MSTNEITLEKSKTRLSEILRILMAEVNITEAELARKTDIPQPTLHRILSGSTKSPRADSLLPLSSFFSLTVNELIGAEPLPADRIPGTFNPNVHGWTSLPAITLEMATSWPETKEQLKKQTWGNWITTDAIVSENAFAFSIQGDSMAPRFPDGTILIVDPDREPQNRDFVIAQLDNQPTAVCKQLLIDGPDRYLKSVNPEFKSIALDENTTYKPIGVIIQARIDFHNIV